MKFKKLIGMTLLSATLLFTFSCTAGQTDPEVPNTPDAPVFTLGNIRKNIEGYTVIRGDGAEDKVTEAASLLCQTIKKKAHAELSIQTDWDAQKEGTHEIVVGTTKREGSAAALAALTEGTYAITEDENGNIFIVGYDGDATVRAVNAFLMQYFDYDPGETAFHNVRSYGALGNGASDDTAAFKNAVNAAGKDGLPVYVPAGEYLISDTVTLSSVTLFGYQSGAWTADDCDLPVVKQANMNAPLFDVRGGSVSGLNIQASGKAGDSKMMPTVLITGTGGRVSDMRIHTPYIGIYTDDTSNPGRCFIDNIFIVEAKEMGVYVAGTYDVPCISNVEVWNPQETCPTAFKFGHNDDLRAVNLFAFNAGTGFSIVKTKTGSCWGSFTNCSVDYTSIGFRIGTGDHHLTIVGGTYWTHHTGVLVERKSEAFVSVSGCEMKSNGDNTLKIEGGKTVAISACSILHKWKGGAPAISVSGGMIVNITGNTVYSTELPIEIKSKQKNSAIGITNNVICTASEQEYTDTSSGVSVKVDNLVTRNPEEFKE